MFIVPLEITILWIYHLLRSYFCRVCLSVLLQKVQNQLIWYACFCQEEHFLVLSLYGLFSMSANILLQVLFLQYKIGRFFHQIYILYWAAIWNLRHLCNLIQRKDSFHIRMSTELWPHILLLEFQKRCFLLLNYLSNFCPSYLKYYRTFDEYIKFIPIMSNLLFSKHTHH